jgi:glutaminase
MLHDLPASVSDALQAVHDELLSVDDGELPDYIPPLAEVDPRRFGLAVCTPDGGFAAAGDHDLPFTVQSISKVFTLALALVDRGLDGVLKHVGVEPSGESFNAVSLEEGTGRPDNPMINAGAIVTCSLVKADSAAARFERILDVLSACAGRELGVDENVYEQELATADRNRALAHFMRSAGSLTADVDETLEVYLRQCAVLVTAGDLAVMAATLAAGGLNPVSGDRVFSSEVARHVLTIMVTCGMYDASGEWMLRVGSPAKSGVAGGIITASPAQFGLGLYSPLLDDQGNSVRAVQACERLAERFSWHALALPEDRRLPAALEDGDAEASGDDEADESGAVDSAR